MSTNSQLITDLEQQIVADILTLAKMKHAKDEDAVSNAHETLRYLNSLTQTLLERQ